MPQHARHGRGRFAHGPPLSWIVERMVLGSIAPRCHQIMRKMKRIALLTAALAAATALAQNIIPPANIVVDGVPPIADELIAKVAPYADFRAHAIVSWHPSRHEMLIRGRLNETNQIQL